MAKKRVKVSLVLLVLLISLLTFARFTGLTTERDAGYGLLEVLDVVAAVAQIAFLVIIVYPFFSSLDNRLHQFFFSGVALISGFLAFLMVVESAGIFDLPIFVQMYSKARWSLVLMEPNSSARLFFTGLIAALLMGGNWLFRTYFIRAAIILLCCAACLLTGSRSFFVAGMVVVVIALHIHRRRLLPIAIRYATWLLPLSVILVVLGATLGVLDPLVPAALDILDKSNRTTLSFAGPVGNDTDSLRIWLLLNSPIIFLDNVLLGTGLEQSEAAFSELAQRPIHTVHNAFINFAVDLGIVGLLLVLAFFIALLRQIRKNPRPTLLFLLSILAFDMLATLQWTRLNWVPIIAFFTWSNHLYQLQQNVKIYRAHNL